MRHSGIAAVLLGALAICTGSLLAAPSDPPCRPSATSQPAPLEPMTATPCAGGFAGIYPCQNVDLQAFLPLAAMGCGEGNSLWGWTDPLDGKEYALMGCDNGISFVDISVPDSPVYLGRLPTHSFSSIWRDVRVYADHAFIVSEANNHGMQVFDLTQLRDVPAPPVTFTETAHYAGFSSSHTIAINEATGFAYAAGSNTCGGGPHMVNIQTPESPAGAGCVSGDGYTHETQCVVYSGPDTEYADHEICFSSNEDTLTIVDVTDKSSPVQLSRTGYVGSGYVHQGWLTEDQAHFLLDDELDEIDDGHFTYTYIWDLANLKAPVLMGHYTGPTPAIDHNLYVRGGYAYEANYRAGLRILDITGVANLSVFQAGFFDIYPADDAAEFNAAWNNYPFFPSGNVIVSGIEQGLFVLHPNLNPNPTALSINDTTVAEGDSGTVAATFTVSLSFAVPNIVTVHYSTAVGTATAGVDFQATSGDLTFDPFSTAQTVTVTVNGDALNEADETFLVVLSAATNATIADFSGTCTILDDDPLPTVSIADASVQEGNSGTATMSFTVSLSAPSGQIVTAQYATAEGTATAGSDYTSISGVVSFPKGTTNQTVAVSVQGDLVDESDETFFVNLSTPINATILDAQAIGVILDDDALSVSSVNPTSGEAVGGTTITISGVGFVAGATVTIGGAEATNVIVPSPGQITATTPALTPGTSNDVVVTIPGVGTATLPGAFFADFLDVPDTHVFHDYINTIARNHITVGCGDGTTYCPDAPVTRGEMAVFLLKALLGADHLPPTATGIFNDVPSDYFAIDWIEDLFARQITGGCQLSGEPLRYCPNDPVTREQMAVLLLKTLLGPDHQPPPAAGIFGDVQADSIYIGWIEDLYNRQITAGCQGEGEPPRYCPGDPNTRGQMAVFLTKTFGLQ